MLKRKLTLNLPDNQSLFFCGVLVKRVSHLTLKRSFLKPFTTIYSARKNNHSHHALGDFLVLLSLLPEAAYYVLCKLHPNRLPIFLTASLLNGINAVLLSPALFLFHGDASSISIADWSLLLVLGLTSGLFFVCWFLGCLRVDGIMASLSTAVMPVATVIVAWIALGEGLTMLQMTGMGLVMISIVAYAR